MVFLLHTRSGNIAISLAMGCMASKSGEDASRTASSTFTKIEHILDDIRHSIEAQRQHGTAFVELGSQLAQLDRLLSELDHAGDKHMFHRSPVSQEEQLTGAHQPTLAEQLNMAQQACTALQQQLDTAQEDATILAEDLATARQNEAQLQEQVLSHQQHVSQLEGSLSTAGQEAAAAAAVAHQETACLQEPLHTVQQQVAGLHQQVKASQQQVADLQEQLSMEQSRAAAVEQLQCELRITLKDRSTALEAAQDHIKQLRQAQQQQEDACAAAAAAHEQLSTDLSKLRESSNLVQHELQKQLTEMSEQLIALTQQLETAQQNARTTAQELTAARQLEAQLQQQELAREQRVSQLEGRLSTALGTAAVSQQLTASLQEQLDTEQQKSAGLQKQVTASQRQATHLQEQLLIECSKVAALEVKLQELQKQLTEQLGTSQEHQGLHKQLHDVGALPQAQEASNHKHSRKQLVALLPSLTIPQLSEYMAPSQPAAVKAAAARELAQRLWELDWGAKQQVLDAFRYDDEGLLSRLVQLLSKPDGSDTQLAALELLKALWEWGSTQLALRLAQQPGVLDFLVRLLHEGDAAKQAASVLRRLFSVHKHAFTMTRPKSLAPARSEPNSWRVVAGLAAVLQSPAAPAEGKEGAADAMYDLMYYCSAFTDGNPAHDAQLYPDIAATVEPLVALLQHKARGAKRAAVRALGVLAKDCQVNQSLIGAVDGAISGLWRMARRGSKVNLCVFREDSAAFVLAAVVKDHGLNQSRLMQQDDFMEDLMELEITDSGWFRDVATTLRFNPDFVQRLCETPTAVLALTHALGSTSEVEDRRLFLALLLSMSKAKPSIIHTIREQYGVLDTLQQLSKKKDYDCGALLYPDANSLLQLVFA